jgi:hypothetical protein
MAGAADWAVLTGMAFTGWTGASSRASPQNNEQKQRNHFLVSMEIPLRDEINRLISTILKTI